MVSLGKQLVALRCGIRPKAESRLMRFVGAIIGPWFMRHAWTTVRLPFRKRVIIYYPSSVTDPYHPKYMGMIEHELVHARQLRPWYGPWAVGLLYFLFPLPVLVSGRYLVERPAYLADILAERLTVDQVVDLLWDFYLFPAPRWFMRWDLNRHVRRLAA